MTLSEVKSEVSRLYKIYREREAQCTSVQRPTWAKQFAREYHVEFDPYAMSTAPYIVDDTCIVKDVVERSESKKTLFGTKRVISHYFIWVFYGNNDVFCFSADKYSGAEKLSKGQRIHIHGKAKGSVDYDSDYKQYVVESERFSFQFTC